MHELTIDKDRCTSCNCIKRSILSGSASIFAMSSSWSLILSRWPGRLLGFVPLSASSLVTLVCVAHAARPVSVAASSVQSSPPFSSSLGDAGGDGWLVRCIVLSINSELQESASQTMTSSMSARPHAPPNFTNALTASASLMTRPVACATRNSRATPQYSAAGVDRRAFEHASSVCTIPIQILHCSTSAVAGTCPMEAATDPVC